MTMVKELFVYFPIPMNLSYTKLELSEWDLTLVLP